MNNNINSKKFSKEYDLHVESQGEQFQIDVYYEPKKETDLLRIRVVIDELAPGHKEKILDIGCGVGTFTFHCAKQGSVSFGLDYSIKSVVMAKNLTKKYSLFGSADFLRSDAMNLPFKDNVFDKIICADFIEHINNEEKEALLKEVYRVLKRGNIAVFFTPNKTREKIGEYYCKLRHILFGNKIPVTDLHFGLISRSRFEKLLKKYSFEFVFKYKDVTRLYLARIPFVNNFLALNLLWIAKKI